MQLAKFERLSLISFSALLYLWFLLVHVVRGTQNPPRATSCEFDSRLGHFTAQLTLPIFRCPPRGSQRTSTFAGGPLMRVLLWVTVVLIWVGILVQHF